MAGNKRNTISTFLSMNRYAARMKSTGNGLLNKILLSETAFSSFFKNLNELNICYLITGHLAAAYHGIAKTSDNIEIWIHPGDVKKLNETLNVSPKIYSERENQKVVSDGEPFALSPLLHLFYFSAKDFNWCHSRATLALFYGVTLPILNIDDLIVEKMALGGLEDLTLVKELEKIKRLGSL